MKYEIELDSDELYFLELILDTQREAQSKKLRDTATQFMSTNAFKDDFLDEGELLIKTLGKELVEVHRSINITNSLRKKVEELRKKKA